jgi:hypothetical protein
MGAPQQLLASGIVVVPGNSGILTSGTSYTLPSTSGFKINVLVIAPGGGGGGGSGRTYASGYYTGGGSGGAGGNAYALNVLATPGSAVTFSIGAVGSAGGVRDGVFTSGSDGTAGGVTSVTVNASVVARATGGNGGIVSPNATAGTAGSLTVGTQYLAPTNGNDAGSGTTVGGLGAKGYQLSTTVGASLASILTYGSTGTAGAENSGQYGVAGTIYGAGGTGGGCAQSDVYNYNNMFSTAGTTGAVFIWWGY